VTDTGNDAGDEFGKSALEEPESTTRVLGNGFGKTGSDEYGTRISPGFICLLR